MPIIFISADENLRFSEQYLKAVGAVGFLQKPFNDQELVDLINIAVENKGNLGNAGNWKVLKLQRNYA
jgi:FixJ family two-component response regulator